MARLVALLFAALSTARAQMGMDQMPKKPKPAPLTADLKYIRCTVCEKLVAEALRQMEELTSVNQVEDMLERLCDADADGKEGRGREGVWMSELDISKQGQALVLENKGPGYCRRECRTIAKSCDSVVEKLGDDDDFASFLLNAKQENQSVGTVVQRVCVKMAGVCKKGKVPLWPEGKPRKNEEFKPKDKTQADVEDLLASLQGMPGGAGMTAMSASDFDLGDGKEDPIDVLKDEM
jgi:hypothetical protein